MRKYLWIEHDADCPSPEEGDSQWKLYAFEGDDDVDPRRFVKDVSYSAVQGWPGRQPIPEPATVGLRRKLEAGTAFWLSCYRHSGEVWSLLGGGPPYDREWDHAYLAGILVWEHPARELGARTYEERRSDAQAFLDKYNDWANGGCYGYVLEDERGDVIDSCWGFVGVDGGLDDHVNEFLDDDDELVVLGEAAELARYLSFKCPIAEQRLVVA